MQRARVQMANSDERVMTDPERIGLALSEYIAMGDWRTFFLMRDSQQKVTAEQVKAATARYLLRDNRTVGMFLPRPEPEARRDRQGAQCRGAAEGLRVEAGGGRGRGFRHQPGEHRTARQAHRASTA